MLRKYLVTGGAGFIGSALVRRLLADGHAVTVLDDTSRGRRDRVPEGVRLVEGDVRDYRKVYSAALGCNAVIHLAGVQGTASFYAEPSRVLDVGLRGMLNVVQVCREHGIRRLMVASSSEAYQDAPPPVAEDVPLTVPDPLNPRYSYATAKIASEVLAAAAFHDNLLDDVMIVRPHNVIGPDMGTEHVVPQFALRVRDLLAAMRELHPVITDPVAFPIQGTGEETRSFCWIGDAVDQLAAVLETSGLGVWHVGAADEHTIAEVAHLTGAVFGHQLRILPGPLQPGSPLRRCPDVSKVAALGVKAQVGFEETVTRTAEWYRDHG